MDKVVCQHKRHPLSPKPKLFLEVAQDVTEVNVKKLQSIQEVFNNKINKSKHNYLPVQSS